MASVYTLNACPRCDTGLLRLDDTSKVITCSNCGYEDYSKMIVDEVNAPSEVKGEFDDFINHVKTEWIVLGRRYRGNHHITQTGFVGDPKYILLKLIARMGSVVELLKDDVNYSEGKDTLQKLSDLLPVLYNQINSDVKVKED